MYFFCVSHHLKNIEKNLDDDIKISPSEAVTIILVSNLFVPLPFIPKIWLKRQSEVRNQFIKINWLEINNTCLKILKILLVF